MSLRLSNQTLVIGPQLQRVLRARDRQVFMLEILESTQMQSVLLISGTCSVRSGEGESAGGEEVDIDLIVCL